MKSSNICLVVFAYIALSFGLACRASAADFKCKGFSDTNPFRLTVDLARKSAVVTYRGFPPEIDDKISVKGIVATISMKGSVIVLNTKTGSYKAYDPMAGFDAMKSSCQRE